jgi:hypothetical protein
MALQIREKPIMQELLDEFGHAKIWSAIRLIITDYKTKMDAIQDLYGKIAKSTNPNEILNQISKHDLSLIPGFRLLIKNLDDKYWHTNLLTAVASELFRVGNIWEWLEGEFGELSYISTSTNISASSDKLLGIYNTELLSDIREKINKTQMY